MDEELKHRRDVLEVFARQFNTFDYDGKSGKANNIELELKFKLNAKVAKTKYIKYDEKREAFICAKVKEWAAKGIVQRGYAQYLFPPVVVDKRNSTESYRLCYNFQAINEATKDEWFPSLDAEEILSRMKGA